MVSRRQFLMLAGSVSAFGVAFVAVPSLLHDKAPATDRLPEVRFGEELCVHCGMLIDDVRFVAAWIGPDDEVHFDDIGCMVGEAELRPAPAGARFFVTEYGTGDWIAAEDAFYVRADHIRSPMAYGLAASATLDAAEQLARETSGTVRRWHHLAGDLRGDHHS